MGPAATDGREELNETLKRWKYCFASTVIRENSTADVKYGVRHVAKRRATID